MAEIINFAQKIKERESIEKDYDDDDDIINAKIVSKEVFFETMLMLEDLGYDVNEDPEMLKDLEALSFLSAAIIFRAHGNEHPGSEVLDATYSILLNINELFKKSELFEDIKADNVNAKTDSSL